MATIKQPVNLNFNTAYTGSVYARTDINLLTNPSKFNTAPWTVTPANSVGISSSTLTNPLNNATDVLQATFSGSVFPTPALVGFFDIFHGPASSHTIPGLLASAPQYNVLVYTLAGSQTGDGNLVLLNTYAAAVTMAADIDAWKASKDRFGNNRAIIVQVNDSQSGGGNAVFLTSTNATQAVASLISIINTYHFQGIGWDLEGGEGVTWNATTINSINAQLKASNPALLICGEPRPYELRGATTKRGWIGTDDFTMPQYYFGDNGDANFLCAQILPLEAGTDGNGEGLSQFIAGSDGLTTCPASKMIMVNDAAGAGGQGTSPCSGSQYGAAFVTLSATYPGLRGLGVWQTGSDASIGFATSISMNNSFNSVSFASATTGGLGRGTISQPFTGAAGQYTMSVWARGTVAGGSFFLGYYNGSTPITQISSKFTPQSGSWQQYPFNFTVAATDVAPTFVISNDATDTGIAFGGVIAFYAATLASSVSTSTFFLAYSRDGTAITVQSAAFNPPNNAWQRYSLPWTTGASDPQPTFIIDNTQNGTAFVGTIAFDAAMVNIGPLAPFISGGTPRPTASNITVSNPGTGVTIAVPSFNNLEQVVSVALATNPTKGTATVSGTNILYTGTGGDSFTYTVSNSGGTSLAGTVSISPPIVSGLQILLCMFDPPNPSVSTNPVGTFTSDLNGRPLDAILDYVDEYDFNHWSTGKSQGGGYDAANQPICQNTYFCWWPNGWNGTAATNIPAGVTFDLATAAAGGYNATYYKTMGDGLATSTERIYVLCINNELNFNGFWPWDMGAFGITTPTSANVGNYILALQNFITTIRFSYTSRGLTPPKIGFKTNCGHLDPTIVYPGDAFIDILVMDLYGAVTFTGTSDADCWANAMSGGGPYAGDIVQGFSQGWGVTTMAAFSANHGKGMGFDEWGWGSNSAGWMTSFLTWCQNNNVVYHSAWNSTAPAAGFDFSLQDNPNNLTVYQNFYAGTVYAGSFFKHFV